MSPEASRRVSLDHRCDAAYDRPLHRLRGLSGLLVYCRPNGWLSLIVAIGPRHMATHTRLGSAGNPDEKAQVASEQAHS
jgi:hypothetical protein